ncbi:hypothetical protein ABZ476_00805, partial [Streptomyces albogriseolus]
MGDTQAGSTSPVRAADAAAPVFSRCVVAGASGGVGGMFTGLLLRSGLEVTRVDLAARREREPGVRDVADDIRAPGPGAGRGGGGGAGGVGPPGGAGVGGGVGLCVVPWGV